MPSSNNPYDLVNALEMRYDELVAESEMGIAANTSMSARNNRKSDTRERSNRSDRR